MVSVAAALAPAVKAWGTSCCLSAFSPFQNTGASFMLGQRQSEVTQERYTPRELLCGAGRQATSGIYSVVWRLRDGEFPKQAKSGIYSVVWRLCDGDLPKSQGCAEEAGTAGGDPEG